MTKTQNQNIYDAQHPARQQAIRIIEGVIEPFLGHDIDGEDYYDLEDGIVKVLTVTPTGEYTKEVNN